MAVVPGKGCDFMLQNGFAMFCFGVLGIAVIYNFLPNMGLGLAMLILIILLMNRSGNIRALFS